MPAFVRPLLLINLYIHCLPIDCLHKIRSLYSASLPAHIVYGQLKTYIIQILSYQFPPNPSSLRDTRYSVFNKVCACISSTDNDCGGSTAPMITGGVNSPDFVS